MDGGHGSAGAEQGDVPALEVEGVKVLHFEHRLLAEAHLLPGAAGGGEGDGLVHREVPLGQGLQDLAPDCTRCADNRDPVAHDAPPN